MYLFLDFDGVLHRTGGVEPPFSHVDHLAHTLADFPNVQVVISSSWREVYSLEEMRWFCGFLASRILDVVPILFYSDDQDGKTRVRLRGNGLTPRVYAPRRMNAGPKRYEEILTWLRLKRRSDGVACNRRSARELPAQHLECRLHRS
jgi:hypothetical protein